jgi:hypothetical protein
MRGLIRDAANEKKNRIMDKGGSKFTWLRDDFVGMSGRDEERRREQ